MRYPHIQKFLGALEGINPICHIPGFFQIMPNHLRQPIQFPRFIVYHSDSHRFSPKLFSKT